MSSGQTFLLLSAVIAVAAALLVWFIIEFGSRRLARYRAEFTTRTGFQLREFFLFVDPQKLFAANLAAMVLVPLAVWAIFGNWVVVLLSLVALAFVPRLLYGWTRRRRLLRFEEQLPDALMMLAGGMRAGLGLPSAMQQLVAEAPPPLSQEFSLLLREQRMGLTLEQTLNNLARRVPVQTTLLVVSAMRIASETGGGLAETLERTAHTLRSRLQMEGKIRALTAQGKLQGWVVGLLPLSLMVILNQMEPEMMESLWHSPLGWATLVVVGFMEVMGIYLIRRIVNIDV